MDAIELAFAGAARQARLVADGTVSSRELVGRGPGPHRPPEPGAQRVPRRLRRERAGPGRPGRRPAVAPARAATRPLLGVPVAIKDDADVAGDVTTLGHRGPRAAGRCRTATSCARLRAAGAIVVGRTNVPELMQWPFTETLTFGATRNPWDLDRTPGRLERRLGRRGRGRPVRRRAGQRRRRLDPHPGRVLRAVRAQAAARAHPARAGQRRRLARPLASTAAGAHGGRRRAVPRRRPPTASAARRLRRGGRAPGRAGLRVGVSTRPRCPGRSARLGRRRSAARSRRPPTCCARSATRSSERRRRLRPAARSPAC